MEILFNSGSVLTYEKILDYYEKIGVDYLCEFKPNSGIELSPIILHSNEDEMLNSLNENETFEKPDFVILNEMFESLNRNEEKIKIPIIENKKWVYIDVNVIYCGVSIKDIFDDGTFEASSIELYITNISDFIIDVSKYISSDELISYVDWWDKEFYKFKIEQDLSKISIVQNKQKIIENVVDLINRYQNIKAKLFKDYVAVLQKIITKATTEKETEIIKIPRIRYEL